MRRKNTNKITTDPLRQQSNSLRNIRKDESNSGQQSDLEHDKHKKETTTTTTPQRHVKDIAEAKKNQNPGNGSAHVGEEALAAERRKVASGGSEKTGDTQESEAGEGHIKSHDNPFQPLLQQIKDIQKIFGTSATHTLQWTPIPVVTVVQPRVQPLQPRPQILLPIDQAPKNFLFANNYQPLAAWQWALQFTVGCRCVAGQAMQRQSLRCRQIDPDSSWECALRSGDCRMWHLSSVLTNSPPDATRAEIVRGGVVYHTGDTSSVRPGDSHGKFLPGEMLCALTIILRQLFHLPVETKRPSPDISARIVSITSSFLRVLEIRYNTDTHGITCEVLTSGNLSFVKEQADTVDSEWITAIELALDIQSSIPFC